MRIKQWIVVLLGVLISIPGKATALSDSIVAWSTDFWAYFPQLYGTGVTLPYYPTVTFCSTEANTVTVDYPLVGFKENIPISANGWGYKLIPIELAGKKTILSQYREVLESDIVHVTSTKPITCYTDVFFLFDRDMSSIFPTQMLGSEYHTFIHIPLPSYTSTLGPNFYILATEDNTDIVVEKENGTVQYSGTLNRGEKYESYTEYAPKRIYSSNGKPISVFQGVSYTTSHKVDAADQLWNQVLPDKYLGTQYLLTTDERTCDSLIIYCPQPNTHVTLNGVALDVHQGRYTQLYKNPYATIESDLPIACGLKTGGYMADYFKIYGADPAFIQYHPWSMRYQHARFYAPEYEKDPYSQWMIYGEVQHFVGIVVETDAVQEMYMDCQNISSYFKPMPGNETYSYAKVPCSYGGHHLDNEKGEFIAIAIGMRPYEEYLHNVMPSTPLEREQYINNDSIVSCGSESVVWHGKQITKTGIYYDTISTSCADTIYTLKATIKSESHTETYLSIEEKDLPYSWQKYSITKQDLDENQNVIKHDTIAGGNQFGCDSIMTLHLHVTFPCEILTEYLPMRWKPTK